MTKGFKSLLKRLSDLSKEADCIIEELKRHEELIMSFKKVFYPINDDDIEWFSEKFIKEKQSIIERGMRGETIKQIRHEQTTTR